MAGRFKLASDKLDRQFTRHVVGQNWSKRGQFLDYFGSLGSFWEGQEGELEILAVTGPGFDRFLISLFFSSVFHGIFELVNHFLGQRGIFNLDLGLISTAFSGTQTLTPIVENTEGQERWGGVHFNNVSAPMPMAHAYSRRFGERLGLHWMHVVGKLGCDLESKSWIAVQC